MDKVLNKQYLKYTYPSVLWDTLKEQFDHVHDARLPTLLEEWIYVHLLDFAKVHDYNQKMLNLQTNLNLCGKEKTDNDMIEKTLETFSESASEIVHPYRLDYEAKRIKSFADLMNLLKKKERHHEIILNNNNLRLAGTKRVPEANQEIVRAQKKCKQYLSNESNYVEDVEMPDVNATIKLKVEDFQTKEKEKVGPEAHSTPDFE
ncbi:uncharacterized protein LOC126804394 [Argentina anserina]|uniref:uncharacterized protein LOC126804394 n=1 Tax=Argentina anserina TaxID=57926 RepID=UPI0021765CE4|nr:uncharacterized protein LOC126804394 [Potentilla anserina]